MNNRYITLRNLAAALLAGLAMSSCQGDWDTPNFDQAPIGNNAITEDGIVTIAELKAMYPNSTANYNNSLLIEDNVKIRGRVIGNDLGSNIYKQFSMEDATGAIIVAVNASGLHGYLAEGQEIILDLKGLYIGSYGSMPEIGQPYNGSIGRMNKELFFSHVKIIGKPDASKIDTIKNFNTSMDRSCLGKLVRLENVVFKQVDGLGTFAPDTAYDKTVTLQGGCVNRELEGSEWSKLKIRTSTYAKFAARKLPYDEVNKRMKTVNLTGIITCYGTDWQLLIRKDSDIEELN